MIAATVTPLGSRSSVTHSFGAVELFEASLSSLDLRASSPLRSASSVPLRIAYPFAPSCEVTARLLARPGFSRDPWITAPISRPQSVESEVAESGETLILHWPEREELAGILAPADPWN